MPHAPATGERTRLQSVRPAWVLLGSMVLGSALGVGLSLRHEAELDALGDEVPGLAHSAPGPVGELVRVTRKADPEALRGIPPFPDVEAHPLFASAMTGRSPLAIAWFATKWSVDEVLRYYEEFYWLLAHPVVAHRYSETAGYVAWLEADDGPGARLGRGKLHMLSALRQGNETIVFLSSNDPLALVQESSADLPEGVPMPPGATEPRVFQQTDEGVVLHSIGFRVPALSVAQVDAFYEKQLREGGWLVTEHEQQPGTATLVVSRREVQETVMVSSGQGGAEVMVSRETHLGPGAKP